MQINKQAVFDCRMVPLPTVECVTDYFLWRQEDAHRNALNSHCYWMLRKNGESATEATEELAGRSVAFKNELLYQNGVNFDTIPNWQKRGVGLFWETFEKTGINPITNEEEVAERRELKVDYDLPLGREYREYIAGVLESVL